MRGYRLSKSGILSGIQCPKRLFLEVHSPDLMKASDGMFGKISLGSQVGDTARQLYPHGRLIEYQDDLSRALQETKMLLSARLEGPLFEATFVHSDVVVRTDIFNRGETGFRLVEVKASTSVKEYHLWDCAVQSWVIEGAGYPIERVEVAHVDTSFVYPGNGDYRGLFLLQDVTTSIVPYREQVPTHVEELLKVLEEDEPLVEMGGQCTSFFECPFKNHCSPSDVEPEYPLRILPHGGKIVGELLAEGMEDIRDVPEGRLEKELHRRVHRVTLRNEPELDLQAGDYLRGLGYPRFYLDFETIQFAVPIWAGTRPYQQIPFQWSCFIESHQNELTHTEFLDTTGNVPMLAFIEKLLIALGNNGPIFVYSSFEKTRLNELARMFPQFMKRIEAVVVRLVDLLPLARKHYYHPRMKGSWSIKAVLPTIAPDLDYGDLQEVRNGTAAQFAYLETIDSQTSASRREELARMLVEYCRMDVLALVRLAWFFQGMDSMT